ncbi:MAG: ribosome-binding factor A [Candidatus Pacebacteria bacterium]|nr:ribosome-binding factor A [Candidatus Paceibacterota bacterium]
MAGAPNPRNERASSNLLHLAADYIAREAGRTTLITPTRIDFSPDRKNATIYVSIFPDGERDNALLFLARHRDNFRDYIKHHGRFAILPFIKFDFDYGEQNRQRLDELSHEAEQQANPEA